MRILVTGATGYVGGRLDPVLLDRGHTVRTTTSHPGRRSLVPATTGPEEADAMGPMPQDPVWAGGGDGRGVLARAADAVRGALPGS